MNQDHTDIQQQHSIIGDAYTMHGGASSPQRNGDEIDLYELAGLIWKKKWIVVLSSFVLGLAALAVAMFIPNRYAASVVLAAAQNENNGGLSGLANQYGSLAVMAGIDLGGGENNRIEQAIELVKSWPFLESFVDKHNLKPQIVAVKGWDKTGNQLKYDRKLYDPETNRWVGDAEPSSWETYKIVSKMISISQDPKTDLVSISVEHYSPALAADFTEKVVQLINSEFQQKDMKEARANIDYLQAKIDETSLAGMQTVFYSMIEAQLKTLMLAEVGKEYLLKTIIPVKIPEEKSRPWRLAIVAAGFVAGMIVGLILILVNHFARYRK